MEAYISSGRDGGAPSDTDPVGVDSSGATLDGHERTYAKRADDDWVNELIAMTRPGITDFHIPRMPYDRQDAFEFHDFS